MIKISDKARQVLDSMSVKKREYEEKKAKKLGFSSIEEYLEDKIGSLQKNRTEKYSEHQLDNAKQVLEQAKQQGVAEVKLNVLKTQFIPIARLKEPKLAVQNKSLSLSQKRMKLSEQKKIKKKAKKQTLKANNPSQQQLNTLLENYQNGRFSDAENLAVSITNEFPKHQFAWKVLGALLKQTGRAIDSLIAMQKSVQLAPQDAEAHSNLGTTLQELDRLDEALASYNQAIALKPDFAEAHSNLGNTLKELGRLDEALASYTQAIALKPDYAIAYWNLHSIQKTIKGAEHWIDKCLEADENFVTARLTKAALRFYQGDRNNFDELMQSEFKQHPWMRSFAWAFSLPNLPPLYFDKWHFFDAIVKKSIRTKPFYEFGVWRASSFRYLIKVFKKGYGFDTFTGLPEDWDVGSRIEKKGTYTSDGNVPKIKGGEFIEGKFENTLPVFFSQLRPIASVINFDADLYSSTICALNFSKKVMDKDTILIFDELLINESWEQDEFKALNEFCSLNNYSYEVIAISFFTKQVAVKLIGI